MNRKLYNLCSFCTESGHIEIYHKNIKYLTYLVNNSGLNPEQEDLFRGMSNILREIIPYFTHKSSVEKNKIISKYYFHFMKHRHLVKKTHGSLLYSPLMKKEVENEFQKYLKLIIDVVNNK